MELCFLLCVSQHALSSRDQLGTHSRNVMNVCLIILAQKKKKEPAAGPDLLHARGYSHLQTLEKEKNSVII